jgi:peptidoglycan hydrolase-like protein with peptidoglycan-binding domain
MENVKEEVEKNSATLVEEGCLRFSSTHSPSSLNFTTKDTAKPLPKSPDLTVLAIQQKLNALGYGAGPADGFVGRKTTEAIEDFKRDHKIQGDLVVQELLQLLNITNTQRNNVFIETKKDGSDPKGEQNLSLPANAKLDYTGHDWECKAGFRRSGDECRPVGLPANAKLDYTGHDWECKAGFRKSGDECRPVGFN